MVEMKVAMVVTLIALSALILGIVTKPTLALVVILPAIGVGLLVMLKPDSRENVVEGQDRADAAEDRSEVLIDVTPSGF